MKRRAIAEMMACGYGLEEMMHRTQLSRASVLRYRKELAEMFWERSQWDYNDWLANEIRNLETVREMALRHILRGKKPVQRGLGQLVPDELRQAHAVPARDAAAD